MTESEAKGFVQGKLDCMENAMYSIKKIISETMTVIIANIVIHKAISDNRKKPFQWQSMHLKSRYRRNQKIGTRQDIFGILHTVQFVIVELLLDGRIVNVAVKNWIGVMKNEID